MSRTVIDGPKRCPRSECLTNPLPIKHHPLEDVRLVLIVSHELEDVRLVLIIFHERWTAGVGGSRLVITLAGGGERWTAEEAVSSSFSLFIDTWVGGCRLGWALGLALASSWSTSGCVFVVVVLMLMLM